MVGECYVHGLEDSVAILGPLPPSWKAVFDSDVDGRHRYLYCNPTTGVYTLEDPRLGPLPAGWERLERERAGDDPEMFERFRNTPTGEMINSGPRLTLDVLRARGVEMATFQLI